MKLKNVENLYPLSPLQKGILFHAVSEPQSSVYLVQFHCTLVGCLDIPAFQRAWQQVLDRHPALRTAFLWEGLDEWLQVVRQHATLPWEVHDWITKDTAEQRRAFDDFLEEDGRKLFNLSQAPLMRVAVIRVKEDLYQLVWTKHHLILDGWSMAVVLKEVLACYQGIVGCTGHQLPLVRPYRDFIAWLRQLDLSQAEFFWKGYLKGFTAPTELPIYHLEDSEAGKRTAQPGRLTRQLSAELSRSLKLFSRSQQLTLNTVFQGAWALLLSRYSGQDDVVFGAVVSGRPAALSGVESMVGLFVNTLPFRAVVSPDSLLGPWLQDLQARFLEARHFEHSALVDVQGWSELPRGTSLFESILAFENYPVDQVLKTSPGDLQISDVGVTDPTNYPLTLEIVPGDQMTMILCYKTDRYEADTIGRVLAQLDTLLMEMAEHPKAQLRDLSFLTPQERQIVLHEWNNTGKDYPADRCAYQLVEVWAERTPGASAVSCEENNLTYRELNQQADRVAFRLRSLGAGPGTPVGLCVERSVEIVVGLLGIWKAGGTYVPLDPTYPDQRLAFMLQDAKPVAVVTQRAFAEKLSIYEGNKVWFEELRELSAPSCSERGALSVTPDDGAYILYTSGSTGVPKGVLMPHRCLTNLIAWQEAQSIPRSARRTLQFASMSFDVSVQEILSTLCAGGMLCIATDEVRMSSEKLLAFIREHQVERVFLPPVAFQHLAEAAVHESKPLPTLRNIICAGEQLVVTPAILEFLRLSAHPVLENHYGPTESHVVTSLEIEGEPPLGPVPIGRPIANAKVYLLDSSRKPVPIGAIGEIYIGGPCLAHGYLNRPELTAERFLSNPFVKGERLYRTGDLARFLANGIIEFIGRRDQQIKLLGCRIELGEVEQILCAHPVVRQAVVVLREDLPGGPRLVAYVEGRTQQRPSMSQLKEFLVQRIPPYMVPSTVVWMEAWPITPTGKINRRALPAPNETVFAQESKVAPRNPIEQALVEIWRTVINVSAVGVHDNFFELGGNSLLATQVASRVREVFQVDLSIRALFDRPTVASLGELITELRQHSESSPWMAPIPPASRERPIPLSHGQERMWFLDQLSPGQAVYNMPGCVRLQGPLDRSALERSLEEIVKRHEVFRTAFPLVNGRPTQAVSTTRELNLVSHDLRMVDPSRRSMELDRLMKEEERRPFDLVDGPLFRGVLVQCDDEEHVLLWTMHHSIADGWSLAILINECTAFYQAFAAGNPSPLRPLPIQYGDYTIWQRVWLASGVAQAQVDYWKQQLAGVPPMLDIPVDYARPPIKQFHGASEAFELGTELTASADELCRRYGVTRFMLFLAVWQTLLHRYSGQETIVVGSPITNRGRVELEALIGFFSNTICLRAEFNGDPTIQELLAQVRRTTVAAFDHQDVPFEEVVEAVQPERDLSRTPLVQAMFVLQPTTAMSRQMSCVTVQVVPVASTVSKVDLTLSLEEQERGLRGVLEYDTALFASSSIQRMLKHFRSLLTEMVKHPEQRVSELPLLTTEERGRLIENWNGNSADYSIERCLPDLIAEQAMRSPDAVAVVCDHRRLSYKELLRQADSLASYLGSLGVGPNVLVGLCMERSVDSIVALLAVHKSGGAYLPLDPSFPQDRLAFMLKDAKVAVILTQQRLESLLRPLGVRTVCMDRDADAWTTCSMSSKSNARPDSLAYVIYTSGSTGTPKGVLVNHRNLSQGILASHHYYREPVRACLVAFSLVFDASAKGVFWTLSTGGTVVLPPAGMQSDVAVLADLIRDHHVSHLLLVPALYSQLLTDGNRTNLSSLKVSILGGEEVPLELVSRHHRLLPDAGLYNEYGPTEATVWASVYKTTPQEPGPRVPIGRPIANTALYILDGHQHPVPVGVPGELYIGGPSVAQGYLNQPELTAARFVPDPFVPNQRLYRTGDVARFQESGEIEFLGRRDHQVKLRGYRIELGEIEAAITAYAGVGQTVVMVREDGDRPRQLAAYVVPEAKDSVTSHELLEKLRESLPAYMVPSTVVFLDRLPMLSNGKLDRRALPEPDYDTVPTSDVKPRSPVEATLVEIWHRVLGTSRLGIHDNFFEKGGHSLLATQVMSRVRELFQLDLPLRILFERPTVAELAAQIDHHMEHGIARSAVPPIECVPRDRPLPLSYSQQRMWLMHQLAPESAAYNMPSTVRLQGPLNRSAMFQAVEYLMRRHEAFRTTFGSVNGEPVQYVAPFHSNKLEEIDLRLRPPAQRIEEATRILNQESRRPFDLARGPLARFLLVQLSEGDHVLMVNVHHIISDQWSGGIISNELSVAYNQLCRNQCPRLEELTIQYVDFARWQRRWLAGETLARQLQFWREQLAGLPVLSLPTDRPRPSRQSFRGSYVAIDLSDTLIQKVKQISWQQGVTLYMTMLACFNMLLNRYSGQEDIAIGSPIANRNHVAVERLVGTFVNTLVMRTDLSGDPTFSQLLGRVRDVCLGAYANQDMPFEKLVDELQVTRDMSHSPLFQVLFNVVNAPMNTVNLDGLTVTLFDSDRGAAQFDLTMSVDSEYSKKVYLEFATDLFDQATVKRMLEQYRILLEDVTADPQRKISSYQFLGPPERRMLIHDWNRTWEDYPRSVALPALITAQAERSPEAVAIAMEGQLVTYRELEARSNQFARYLCRQGIRRGDLVGICLDRSPTMVVGLLAILKAGAAYVPLDPDYPRERVRFMVEDSGGRFVVTSSMLADRIPPEARQVICVDREADRIAQEAATTLEGPQPSDVAYVIYTSGSTGKPKGVEIQHQALVNFLWSMQKRPGVTERDILLSVTTLSFDIAGLELYLPLTVGARVVLVSRSVAMNGRQLMQRLEHSSATMMQATPATWRMLIDAGWKGSRNLTVLCGGEPLPRELAEHLLTCVSALWNMYGPTETTIWSTVSKVESADDITIGRPIANTELYILDRTEHPVPIGVPGELHIGGDGLARGYRNRPELTSERFIPHPFTDRAGARIYKTGDLARFGADGRVIHLGRLDHQVKIRGFRIELGEIETILNRHPAVKQVVVAAREDRAGVKSLVAYLIPADGQQLAASELRTFLRANLPDYMVPSYFVSLEAFPLSANGKVDVKALPPPLKDTTVTQRRRVPAHTSLEIQLTALWQQVLGQHDISVHDNFFDLGGHSLSAVQLFAHLEQVFGKQLPLATLFQAPTVAQLAKVLTAAEWTPPWRSLVAIQPSGDATPFFAVPGVGGNVLVFAKLAKLLGADQPFYGLQTKGLDGKEEPFTSIAEMATHYIAEIRSVQPHGPYFIGGTCTGGVVAYEIAQQFVRQGEQVTLMIMESWHPSSYRIHQHKPPMLLWPLLFAWAKVAEYLGTLSRLPVKAWSSFVRGKVKKLGAVLSGKAQETLRDSAFDVECVKQATFLAVSRYEAKAYAGCLLNVIASKRPIAERTLDTRAIWGTLAQNSSQTIYIPAEDSGRLFVSPHVEELAHHLTRYMSEESEKRSDQSYSKRHGNGDEQNIMSVA